MTTTRKPLKFLALTLLIAVLLLVVILRFINSAIFKHNSPRLELVSCEENDVKVTVFLEYDDKELPLLTALFEPLLKGHHFYSKNTPKTGVDGIGRPTLIELSPNASIVARGNLIESRSAIMDAYTGLAEPLYIYPDGPITLQLPITIPTSNQKSLTETIFVTYMTCSSNGLCTAPVVEKAINITIPLIQSDKQSSGYNFCSTP
jgi:hypothetical protein